MNTIVPNISQRDGEIRKFVECNGEIAIRTKLCQEAGEAVNVNVIDEGFEGETVNYFNAITALASSTETSILSVTVPTGKSLVLKQIETSGTNVAKYTILKNGITIAVKRTSFTDFNTTHPMHGLVAASEDVLTVTVVHERSYVGDFEARIIGKLT